MELEKYEEILTFVHSNFDNSKKCIEDLLIIYPGIQKKTLFSIFSQEFQKKMKKIHHLHSSVEKSNEYYSKYIELKKETQEQCVIENLAYKVGLSPYLMARIIIERHLSHTKFDGAIVPKSQMNALLKNIKYMTDDTLEKDVAHCSMVDPFYGPIAESIKMSIGHEYEVILKTKLDEYGIPYQDENHLRSRGYDKTPDTILQIPIALNGHVVNWIESKALFGDRDSHQRYLKEQLNCYINRFGTGLVIYWLGYIKGLDQHNKEIMIMDKFPEKFKTLEARGFDLFVRTIS